MTGLSISELYWGTFDEEFPCGWYDYFDDFCDLMLSEYETALWEFAYWVGFTDCEEIKEGN